MIKPNSNNEIVLKEFKARNEYHEGTPENPGLALIWDFEANGLLKRNPDEEALKDVQPFEVGIVALSYDKITGQVYKVIERYSEFEDIGVPIKDEVSEITGITNEMIEGHHFDDDVVNRLIGMSTINIAHNASYDAPIAQYRFPALKGKPWACSLNEIDWRKDYGMGSRGLEFLVAFISGYFYNAHRAIIDADVLADLLAQIRDDGTTIFSDLMNNVRKKQIDIYAVQAPFSKKDILSGNGYYWHPGGFVRGEFITKAWHKPVDYDDVDNELQWLNENVYNGYMGDKVQQQSIDAWNRYAITLHEVEL